MKGMMAVAGIIILAAGFALAGCSGTTPAEPETAVTAPAAPAPAAVAPAPATATPAAVAAAEQKTCPVMQGNPINKDIYVDYEGRRIYFCCAGCPDMFRQDPAKYLAILDGPQPATAPATGTHRH